MDQAKGKSARLIEIVVLIGRYGTIIALLSLIIGFSILLPPFRSLTNLLNLLGQTAILSVFAAGLTCCLKMGDFDLSIGANAALTGIVVAKVLVHDGGIPLAIVCGLLVGGAIGLMNGVFVAYLGLHAFVCTLASMSIVLGLGMAITKGISIWDLPASFDFIGRGQLMGIPNRFIIMILLLIILWFIHTYTTTGRRMEAIGGNATAARLSGINVEWNRLLGYLLAGVSAAVGGLILTSSSMSASTMQGPFYLLDAFGASFIGAATVRIGQFHIWGTFVGVLIVVVAVNGLVILMVPGYFTDLIKGIILLMAIVLSGAIGKFVRI